MAAVYNHGRIGGSTFNDAGSRATGNTGTAPPIGAVSTNCKVAWFIQDERQADAETARRVNEPQSMYPLSGAEGEFDIHHGDLVFSTGVVVEHTGVQTVQTVHFGMQTGLWSVWDGIGKNKRGILRGVAWGGMAMGDLSRGMSNNKEISVILHGVVSLMTDDDTINPGDRVFWVEPNTTLPAGADPSAARPTLYNQASTPNFKATVMRYGADCCDLGHTAPMRLLKIATGETKALDRIPQIKRLKECAELVGLAFRDANAAVNAIAERDGRTRDQVVAACDTLKHFNGVPGVAAKALLDLEVCQQEINQMFTGRIVGVALSRPVGGRVDVLFKTF